MRPWAPTIVLSQGTISAHAAARIGDLVEDASSGGPLSVIAVDIPVGLPDMGRRQADLLVRKAVGPRRASVFITPVRPALEAADFASATAVSLRLAGEGISRQAFALRPRSSKSTSGYGRPGTASWKSIQRPASRSSPAHPCIPANQPGPA